MPCTPLVTDTGTVVGIACGPTRRYRRFYSHCEVCHQRRAMARRWDGIYYGYTESCLGCGTYWMDGTACNKQHRDRETALRWWREAIPAIEFDAWVHDRERTYFEADE